MPESIERQSFKSKSGHVLSGALVRPEGPIRAVALFAHCFTCSQFSHAATRVTNELARLGIAAMRFDFTGLGASEGDFGERGFPGDVEDLMSAAAHLQSTIGGPHLMIGHSFGGAAVICAAAQTPGVKAVATIGAPSNTAHVLHNIQGDLDQILSAGSGEVRIGGRPFNIGATFVRSTHEGRVLEAARQLRRPLLITHAPLDSIVGIDNARELFEAALHPKSFLSLDNADHLLTSEPDAHYAARMISAWAERYIME